MADHPFTQSFVHQRQFFLRSISCFKPEHAGFAPKPGMLTVANQIAHAAFTVDWFMAGIFSPTGFDMDFAAHETQARAITTLDAAIAQFNTSYDAAIARSEATTRDEFFIPIAAGPILGGVPRIAVFECLSDHTAHHRGALTVYARLLDLVPPMPYG